MKKILLILLFCLFPLVSYANTYNIASDSNVTIWTWGNSGYGGSYSYWDASSDGTIPYSGFSVYTIPYEGEQREVSETSFYFSSIDIPKGATIISATLNFTSYPGTYNSFSLDIQACAEDNSTLISSDTDFNSRSRTTANINWVQTITGNTNYNTPDFKSVIQEMVNRSGWASGNHLQLIISDHTYKTSLPGDNARSGYVLMNRSSVNTISLTITYAKGSYAFML